MKELSKGAMRQVQLTTNPTINNIRQRYEKNGFSINHRI